MAATHRRGFPHLTNIRFPSSPLGLIVPLHNSVANAWAFELGLITGPGDVSAMDELEGADELTLLPVANPDAEIPPDDLIPGKVPLPVRLVTLIVIVVPLLGLVAAPFFLWGWGFSWVDLGVLIGHVCLDRTGDYSWLPPLVHPPQSSRRTTG